MPPSQFLYYSIRIVFKLLSQITSLLPSCTGWQPQGLQSTQSSHSDYRSYSSPSILYNKGNNPQIGHKQIYTLQSFEKSIMLSEQMFADWQQMRYNFNHNEFRAIPLAMNEKMRIGYEHLLPELKLLYNKLFNNGGELISLQEVLPFQPNTERPTVCNKDIKKNEISYRCFDCLKHEASMICEDCFHKGDHKGHRYRQIKEEGCCDCGNQRILKAQCFCGQHRPKLNRKIKIPTDKRITFQLYIKQLFIWSLKIWNTINAEQGLCLFYNLLKYIAKLNTNSPYYNQLTVEVFFEHKKTIMEQIIHISLTQSGFKEKINKVVFEFMMELTKNEEFKEKLLKIIITLYNKVENFQTSKFMKFMPILLTDSMVVINGMKYATQTLNPTERQYKTLSYYQHLMMLRYLDAQAVEIFFQPLMKNGIVPSPLLQLIQKKCQSRNYREGQREIFLSAVTQNVQEEFVYYRLLSMIIGATKDKNTLEKMIINYGKKIMQYTFITNKIVLIPQRIWIWTLFKYCNYQVSNLNFEVLKHILNMQKGFLTYFLTKILYQILDCLGQYALDLVRNTYFYNYRNMYIREQSQVVMIDYLAIKMLAQLFQNYKSGSFITVLSQYFQNYFKINHYQQIPAQKQRDSFDRLNKLVQILIEIMYSPKVEVINNLFLNNKSNVQRQIATLLSRIVKTRGKINQQQYQSILKQFFFNQSINQIVLQVLSFNKETKKYQIIPNAIQSEVEQIRFDLIVSLTHTGLQSFMGMEIINKLQLSKEQKKLRDQLFSPQIISELLQKQLSFIKRGKLQSFATNLIELTKVTNKINSLFQYWSQQCKIYLQKYRQLISLKTQQIQKDQNSPFNTMINNLPSEFQKIVNNSNNEAKEDLELKKRKELAKAKRQRLMKERKMVQNSQLHLNKYQHTLTQITQNEMAECLICRQKQQSNKLCYFAKVKQNNIFTQVLGNNSKHLMFYTCFHTVHLQCYLKQTAYSTSINCPLCQLSCNIVLPHQNGSLEMKQLLVLLTTKYQARKVITQIIIYISYLIIINVQNDSLTERQLRLCSSLYQFLFLNQQDSKQRKEELKEKKQTEVGKVIRVMYQLFEKSTSTENIYEMNQFTYYDNAQQTLQELTQLLGQYVSCRILKNLLRIIDKDTLKLFEWQAQPKPINKIIKFYELPEDITELLYLRDRHKCNRDPNHSIALCVICGQALCQQCKLIRSHSDRYHNNQSIYFKTNTGGFIYGNSSTQLQIRSFFVNELGTIWKPELQSKDFKFDSQLFEKVSISLKHGNLFYFLTHQFQGLKGKKIDDII